MQTYIRVVTLNSYIPLSSQLCGRGKNRYHTATTLSNTRQLRFEKSVWLSTLRRMYSNLKSPSNFCNFVSVIAAVAVNIAVVGVYTLMILRGNAELPCFARELQNSFVKQNIILSGLNCPMDVGVLRVKTTDIWDSKVVKVTKHSLELCIRGIRTVKT